jgi:exosortase
MQLEEQRRLIPQKNVLNIAILFFILIALFWPVFPVLYHDWFKYNNNSHGILVPFISLYLIWRCRQSIDLKDAHISYAGLGILVVSLFLYVAGYGGRIDVLSRFAFVSAVIGIVLYNYGEKIFLSLAFPLLFLYFMIPVPVSIEAIVSFRLQLWVTQLSSAILSALSITVLQEGNILQFANCSLEVAEACSGIRSLTAYIMLGCLFGYMMRGSFIRRSMMVIIAVPLAFLVNILRVVGTGVLANYYGSHVARGFLHEFSGIAVFLVGFFLFFLIYRLIEEKDNSLIQ